MEDEAEIGEVRAREDESVGGVMRHRLWSNRFTPYRNVHTPWYSMQQDELLLKQLGMCQFHVQAVEKSLDVEREERNVLNGKIESLMYALALSKSKCDAIQSQYDKVKNELDLRMKEVVQLRKEATEWKQYVNTITKMKHESGSQDVTNPTTGNVVQSAENTLTDHGTLTAINDLVEQLQSALIISPIVAGEVTPESENSDLNSRVTTDAEGGVTKATVPIGTAQSVMGFEIVRSKNTGTSACDCSSENTKHLFNETHCRMEEIIPELKLQLSVLKAQLQDQSLTQHQLPASQNVGKEQQVVLVSQGPQQDRADVSQKQEVSDDDDTNSSWEVL